jgi:hypothetical protein
MTRLARSSSRRSRADRALGAALVTAILLAASPSFADFEWPSLNLEGSKAEDVLAKGIDVTLVRPLATARVVIGCLFFIPAAILSAPAGREEGFDVAFDVMIAEPSEYAFQRKVGEF